MYYIYDMKIYECKSSQVDSSVSTECRTFPPWTCSPLVGGTPNVSSSWFLRYPDVSPLYCYMRIDRALDSGTILVSAWWKNAANIKYSCVIISRLK